MVADTKIAVVGTTSYPTIQDAFDSVAKHVIVPAGGYTVSSPLILSSANNNHRFKRIHLQDCDITADAGFPANSGIFDITARHVHLFGPAELHGGGNAEYGVLLGGSASDSRNRVIEHLRIDGVNYGLRCTNNIWASRFSDIRVETPQYGFFFTNVANTTLVFETCYVSIPSARGFVVSGFGGCVNSCAVDGHGPAAYGIEVQSGSWAINGWDHEGATGGTIQLTTSNPSVAMVGCLFNTSGNDGTSPPICDVDDGNLVCLGCRIATDGSGRGDFFDVASGAWADWYGGSRNPLTSWSNIGGARVGGFHEGTAL